MAKVDDDDIPTPSTSRSNSINEDEEDPTLPPSSAPTEGTNQSKSFPISKHISFCLFY